MAKYALIQFKINNDFFEWESAFYGAQATARKHGIVEIFHGMKSKDPSSCAILAMIDSEEQMNDFMENAGDLIAKSGHILESTEVTIYEN
ncbi:DUF3764 family protein [Pseudomonadota bacterium]|nr:DUF3764 family protein [Pseudomonadota bacterium]|tara:strand:- start:123 stop:392 length:270 start_codon:yes stop_codon:yes gene_type:complete